MADTSELREKINGVVYRTALRALGKKSAGVLRELGHEISDAILALPGLRTSQAEAQAPTPVLTHEEHGLVKMMSREGQYKFITQKGMNTLLAIIDRLAQHKPAS